MKPKLAQPLAALAACLFGLMLAGCSTTPLVDWNTRIGIYTYDQTVQELGAPAKSTKQDDGSVVAEWFLRRIVQSDMNAGVGAGISSPGGAGVGVNQGINQPPRSEYQRLTFGPDGKLKQSMTITR